MSSNTQSRTEFASALSQICAERGIEPEVVIETIKTAILAAFRKDYPDYFSHQLDEDEEPTVAFEVDIDDNTGSASVFMIENGKKKDLTPPGFGRIAAQTAKQVILQRVREAEKDAIITEYEDKIGTMITGMVLRFDGKNVIFDIGRGQGYMPPEEQIRGEFYKINQRMAVYLEDIRETMRGKTIIVSRSSKELVRELFNREVPEVSTGAVEIKALAREAGVRTKIAVDSSQPGVDPVGSCVGQKGVRVQEVINELNNEKIDIIQYSSDPKAFIAAALAPADNLSIEIDEKNKIANVTVPDDQLSLAIGRGGQNVRLAAKLTEYKIEMVGASGGDVVKAETASVRPSDLLQSLDLPDRIKKLLSETGIVTMADIYNKRDSIGKIKGIGPKAVDSIKQVLDKYQATDVAEA